MKILVLGATGATGHPLVQQALDQGHEVVALVRTRSKMKITDEKLTVVEGNVFSKEDLERNLQDVNVVMSTLGFAPAKNLRYITIQFPGGILGKKLDLNPASILKIYPKCGYGRTDPFHG